MATNFANVDSLGMGKLLDIIFTKGVRDQLPQNFEEFNLIKTLRVPGNVEREIRHQIQTGRGPGRVQAASPGVASANFPMAQEATIQEVITKMKQYEAVTAISAELFERLRGTSAKAAEELALEMEATIMDIQRRLAIDFYGDGSGCVVRQSGAVTETKGDSTNIDYVTCTAQTAAPGSITFLEPDDLLLVAQASGAARAPTETSGSDFFAWKVVSIDVDAGTFVIKPVDSAGVLMADVTASNIATTDCFYRRGVGTATVAGAVLPATDTVADWAVASNSMLGLESLTASDGRVVAGMTMSNLLAGSRHDCGGDLIDVLDFQKAVSKAKKRVGTGGYKWDSALMPHTTYDALVDSREASRSFVSLDDTIRGGKKFGYQHGNDMIEFVVSEFCPLNRVYMLPKGGKNGKAIGLHLRDAEHLKGPSGEPWHLNVNSSGFIKQFVAYHMLFAQLCIFHPAACVVLTNFLNT